MRRQVAVFALAILTGVGGFLAAAAVASSAPDLAGWQAAPPQEAAADQKIPPEEARKENPVKADSVSIGQGRRFYETQCKMCHGPDGNGKGDLAEPMELKLRDYRDPEALKDFTDGELSYIILKGRGKMPDQEGRVKQEQVWHLVNYIRSLAKKPPAAKAEEKKPD
jgi:mono/diheme cytochrome c family protein